jgi:putative transposase
MQRSKVEVFVHYVWTTWRREPFLTPEVERRIHRAICGEVKRLKCVPIAIGGMPDHVHLVVELHSTVSIARLAQAVKGGSSTWANRSLGFEGAFDWQQNYAAFSVGGELDAVIGYVRNQKKHHASGDVWPE